MSEPGTMTKFRKHFRRSILRAFPPCSEVVRIISASLDRPLTLRERFVMKMHLVACKPCVRYLDQSSFLARALKVMDENEKTMLFAGSLRAESRTRIKEMLRSGAISC